MRTRVPDETTDLPADDPLIAYMRGVRRTAILGGVALEHGVKLDVVQAIVNGPGPGLSLVIAHEPGDRGVALRELNRSARAMDAAEHQLRRDGLPLERLEHFADLAGRDALGEWTHGTPMDVLIPLSHPTDDL